MISPASAKTWTTATLLAWLMVAVQLNLQEALADPLPPELIPPDVTLIPNVSGTSGSSSSDPGSTPGLTSGTGGKSSGANAPSPPPAGSSAKFSGFAGAPPAAPAGHKGQSPAQPPEPSGGGPASANNDPVAVIETNRGSITMRLFKQHAPKTVEAFVSMVNQGFYNGLTWHRVVPGFVIQGGCPHGNGTGLYVDPKTSEPRLLMLEASPHLKHNMAGVVAMAHSKNPNSSSCQFYITLSPQPSLDMRYTVFGGVLSGMDVVKQIQIGDNIVSIRMQQ